MEGEGGYETAKRITNELGKIGQSEVVIFGT
jgi:hypothetical protein